MSGLMMPTKALVLPGGIKPISDKKEAFQFDDEKYWVDLTMQMAGPMDDIDLFYGQVLVAKHIRETVGTMRLVASEQTKLEDRYQGKVGVVLKLGPLAFKTDTHRNFGGAMPQIGQWVMYGSSDGRDADLIGIDGLTHIPCRILEDAEVKGVLKYPARIW